MNSTRLTYLQCLKVVYHEYPFTFSVMSVIPYSQERILEWLTYPLPRLDQKVMTSSTASLFNLASSPPTRKSNTDYIITRLLMCSVNVICTDIKICR